jgi:hypothetical protein
VVATGDTFEDRTERGTVLVGADGLVTVIATVVVTPLEIVDDEDAGIVDVLDVAAAAIVEEGDAGIVEVLEIAVSATTEKSSALPEEIPA